MLVLSQTALGVPFDKAALWRQAFIGDTWASCAMGQVVAIRRLKGQLLAMIRGWKRWHAVERVEISESWLAGMVLQTQSCREAGILT
jgi:Na+-transporting NADH:ubiquinone oxidoreductase subunit NqrB